MEIMCHFYGNYVALYDKFVYLMEIMCLPYGNYVYFMEIMCV